jgi:hypothetical protein
MKLPNSIEIVTDEKGIRLLTVLVVFALFGFLNLVGLIFYFCGVLK